MGPKKKLSKKEKAKLEAEQAELLRIEMEKEKQRKLEEERERKQKEREEAEKRQKQEIIENCMRRQQLKESVGYFDEIQEKIFKIREHKIKQKEWEQYMRCNGLPNARNPGDLRKYVHMWATDILERKNIDRNWLLKTDERTVLTQDRNMENLTKENLRKQQGTLGDAYSMRIEEILGILEEMEGAIIDENLSSGILRDLNQLKKEFRDLLNNYIDDFTYKIMSHISRDMTLESPGNAKHLYQSNVFKSQIWTMQGESQTNNKDKFKEDNRHSEIDFPLLEVQLMLPPTVKLANSALRGLWLNYDHFSDYCPSYRMPNLGSKDLNILQQTKKEWKKRKEILQSTLEEAAKDTPLTSFDSVDQPEPRVIDVDRVYTDYEDEENRKRRRNLGPESLKLSEYDVNLRSHRVIGGVFCIDYLDQPQQDKRLNPRSFIRTIISPNKLTKKDFHQAYKPPPAPQPGVRRLPEEIEAEMKMIERNLDRLGMITLQLPESVLWFEPPIVCRWETIEDAIESEMQTGTSDSNPKNQSASATVKTSRKRSHRRRKSIRLDEDKPVKEVTDFDIRNIPNNIDLYGLMVDFIVPRLPNGYCIRMEYRRSIRHSSILRYVRRSDGMAGDRQNLDQDIPASGVASIRKSLAETNSPRPFHPRVVFHKILQIEQSCDVQLKTGGVLLESIQEGNDESDEDEHFSLTKDMKLKSQLFASKYMFSQLVEDLDSLCDLQTPYVDRQILEINSNMSSPRESDIESPIKTAASETSGRRFSGIVIIRESEVAKRHSMSRQNDANEEETEEIESGSEYEDEPDLFAMDSNSEDDEDREAWKSPGRWSSRDVHDAKFNEDKLSIQFRIGRLGFFGFAANRYSNIPYQTWEIKPDFKNSDTVLFTLTAAVISIEITISNEGFRVNTFQGGTTETLTKMIGQILQLSDLKAILTGASVDIFPDKDAFCYAEGSCEKNFVMEMHLYNCMSSLALSHNFSWSRWNLLSGSRTAVLLMREMVEHKKPPNHATLYVTPLKASVVDCTEVSANFSIAGIPGMEYYADLYNLAKVHSLPSSRDKQQNMNAVLRDNIAEILKSTRPLSFC